MSEIKFVRPTCLVLAIPMALLAIVLRADERGGNKTNDQFTVKGNRTPICPAGGTYTYNAMGADPECSVPGHALR